jgi:hypothetical protein
VRTVHKEVFVLDSERMRKGLRVQVSSRQGLNDEFGSITQVYGVPSYRAAEVLMDSGTLELFWFYQLEEVPAGNAEGT